MTGPHWNLLLVDDEPDVHEVMRLALKNRRWLGYEIRIASAYSADEARAMLKRQPDLFHAAMIDGVMESNSAGLDLCRELSSQRRRSLQVIFHSGIYSERYVRMTFGPIFDAFLPKAEVTAVRLYNTVTRCFSPDDPRIQEAVAA